MRIDIFLESGHPTLICEGRAFSLFNIRGGFIEWADEYCPDVQMSNIQIGISLNPYVDREGELSYGVGSIGFNADMDLIGFPDPLVTAFNDYKNKTRNKIRIMFRDLFRKEEVKKAIASVLMAFLNRELGKDQPSWPGIERLIDVQIENKNMIVKYVKAKD